MRRWPAFAAPVGFVVLLVLVVSTWTPLRDLDHDVADGLNRLTAPHPGAVSFWKIVSTVGQPLTFQVVAAVVAIVLWRRAGEIRTAVFVAVAVLSTGVVTNLVKLLVGRDRPTVPDPVAHAAASSFPSGHAMASFAAVTVFLVVALPRTRHRVPPAVAGAAVVLLVGFSRLALGVHYLSDVVAGWLLAISWVLLVRAVCLSPRALPRPRRALPDRPPGTPVG